MFVPQEIWENIWKYRMLESFKDKQKMLEQKLNLPKLTRVHSKNRTNTFGDASMEIITYEWNTRKKRDVWFTMVIEYVKITAPEIPDMFYHSYAQKKLYTWKKEGLFDIISDLSIYEYY